MTPAGAHHQTYDDWRSHPSFQDRSLKEGPSSTVWISSKGDGVRKLWIDRLWVASTSAHGTHALLAHYPIMFHPDPKKVAGIAFGTGQTFGACLLYPIERID